MAKRTNASVISRHEGFSLNFSHTLLILEKWSVKIFAIFESFVYRIAADWTLSKLARSRVITPFTRFSEFFLCDECGNEAHGVRECIRGMI
ncbi:MAG: hypothetical protein ACLQBD_21060 [Syntrophobacteraceae bacterium]